MLDTDKNDADNLGNLNLVNIDNTIILNAVVSSVEILKFNIDSFPQ